MNTNTPLRKSFRGWSLLLAVLLTLACMPAAVWAADDTASQESSGGSSSDNSDTQVGLTIAAVVVAVFVWVGLRSDFGRGQSRHRPADGTQIALRNSRARHPVYLDFPAPEPSATARSLPLAEPERMDMAARVGLRVHF